MVRDNDFGPINPLELEIPLGIRYIDELPDAEFQGKIFIDRVDYNDQQWDEKGNLIGARRFRASIPTIRCVLDRGGRVIILTHQGRPTPGKISNEHALNRVADAISEALSLRVQLLEPQGQVEDGYNLVAEPVKRCIQSATGQKVFILGNTRFDPREQFKDQHDRVNMAAQLATIADYFVLDGFPIAHRGDTTVTELPKHITSFGGLWLRHEIEMHKQFLEALQDPRRGKLTAIFGGIKADKLKLMAEFVKLMREGDALLLAGTLHQHMTPDLQQEIKQRNVRILAQVDSNDDKDIGPTTLNTFFDEINNSELVFWNGPLGKFEVEKYAYGTALVANQLQSELAAKTMKTAFISGGETAFAVSQTLKEHPTNGLVISTGGGASTAFFANRGLIPGLIAISTHVYPRRDSNPQPIA